jgi:Rod binding domain-containing protein
MTVAGIGGATPDPSDSVSGHSPLRGLPPGNEKRTDAERAALGFERMLLVQLTEQLAKTAQPTDEASSAASGAYRDLLPGALADAMVANGGIGLADSLAKSMEPGA